MRRSTNSKKRQDGSTHGLSWGFGSQGGGQILHPPSVQFNLYQGEVLPYNPGTRDWVESTHSETPQAPTQSVRGFSFTPFGPSLMLYTVFKFDSLPVWCLPGLVPKSGLPGSRGGPAAGQGPEA